MLGDPTYFGYALGEGLVLAFENNPAAGWSRLGAIAADLNRETLNWTVFTGYHAAVRRRAPEIAEALLDALVADPALRSVALPLAIFQTPTGDAGLERILTLLRDPALDGDHRRIIQAIRLDDSVGPDRIAELIDVLVERGDGDPALFLLWIRDEDAPWSAALRTAAAKALLEVELAPEQRSQHGWDRRLARIADQALAGADGETLARRLLARIVALGDDAGDLWKRDLPERLAKTLFTRHPRLALDAFLPWLTDERRYALRSLVNEHDDDDHPARSAFNRVPDAVMRDWILEDPAVRAQLVAEHGSYFERRPDQHAFLWSPLARLLIDLALPEVLDTIGMRLDGGMSSGGWADRHARRRPMVEALLEHPSPIVRTWAEGLLVEMDESNEERRRWDRRPPDRFE